MLVPLLGQDWPSLRAQSSTGVASFLWENRVWSGLGGKVMQVLVCVGKRSVPQWAVAPGSGDVQEGGAHQAEGLFAHGRHVVRRHPLRLDLREDLQSDGACTGRVGGRNENSDVARDNDN